MKISIPYFKFISNLLQGTFRWVKEPCWPIVVGNWHIFKVLRLVQMCIMDTNHVSVLRPRSRGNVRGYEKDGKDESNTCYVFYIILVSVELNFAIAKLNDCSKVFAASGFRLLRSVSCSPLKESFLQGP